MIPEMLRPATQCDLTVTSLNESTRAICMHTGIIESSRLKPTGRLVLSEAIYEELTPTGLWIPPEAQERYPSIGRVVNIGPACQEDIREGDIAVFSTEMFDAPNTYMDFFSVILRDGEENIEILVTKDVEPLFEEQMRIYRENRSTEDRWIQLLDIQTDVAYKFLASDVVDYGPILTRVSEVQKLRYVETMMFPFYNGERISLFYLTDEREIQAVIRETKNED